MQKGRFGFFLPLALTAVFLSGASRAQGNLVVNGGFESSGGWEGTHGAIHYFEPGFVKEGSVVGGLFNSVPLLQRLNTEPATPYVLEFSLRPGVELPQPVTVTWGSQTLGDFSNPSTAGWRTFRVDVTAEAAVTELSFVTLGNRLMIDEISVTAVPEPGAEALGVAGFLLVGWKALRRWA